jgi:hypothetical protein
MVEGEYGSAMTRTRALAPILAAGLFFAACSGDDDTSSTTAAPVDETAPDSTEAPTTAAPTTLPDSETTVAEPWKGDAEAAIAAIQGHLDTVHSGAAYYPQFVGVAIDPETGRASIETSLDPAAVDAKTYALAVCTDAAMVDPAAVRAMDVLDSAGNVVATIDSGGECA